MWSARSTGRGRVSASSIKGLGNGAVRVNPNRTPFTPPPQLPFAVPLATAILVGDDDPSSPDLLLLLLLLHLLDW
jgi:hypothetical protein